MIINVKKFVLKRPYKKEVVIWDFHGFVKSHTYPSSYQDHVIIIVIIIKGFFVWMFFPILQLCDAKTIQPVNCYSSFSNWAGEKHEFGIFRSFGVSFTDSCTSWLYRLCLCCLWSTPWEIFTMCLGGRGRARQLSSKVRQAFSLSSWVFRF